MNQEKLAGGSDLGEEDNAAISNVDNDLLDGTSFGIPNDTYEGIKPSPGDDFVGYYLLAFEYKASSYFWSGAFDGADHLSKLLGCNQVARTFYYI
ncbi:MAG: hypothetical protein WBM04_14090, partial [Candidatus Korobacteraceae bacterium]